MTVSGSTVGMTGAVQEVTIGTSSSPISYTAGTPNQAFYYTNSSTSSAANSEPFYLKSTLTGAGGVGGRARFHTYSNVVSGGWVNAIKGYMEFGSAGRTTGLASAICGEILLSAATTVAHYSALEAELLANSGAATGQATSFIYCNAGGDSPDTVDSNAYLFDFGAELDAASGKFIDTDITTHSAYGGIRVYIDGVGTKYIALVSD